MTRPARTARVTGGRPSDVLRDESLLTQVDGAARNLPAGTGTVYVRLELHVKDGAVLSVRVGHERTLLRRDAQRRT